MLHGVGAGALMQDGIDLAIKLTRMKTRQKVALVKVITDLAIDQIMELGGIGQVINGNNVGDTTFIKCLDDIGTDKTCCAGNEDCHDVLRGFCKCEF